MLYVELLRKYGLDVWIDESGINASSEWAEQIVNAITDCDVFILFLSETSVASENVRKEIGVAASQKKKILPLKIEEVEIPAALLYHLNSIHFIEAKTISHEQVIEHVFNAVGRSMPIPETTTPDHASPVKKRRTPLIIALLLLVGLIGGFAIFGKKDTGDQTPSTPKSGAEMTVGKIIWLNPDQYDSLKVKFRVTNNHSYPVTMTEVLFKFYDVTDEELEGSTTRTITGAIDAGEVKEINRLDLGAYPKDTIKIVGEVVSASKADPDSSP